jgi:large subunit ribosomal protein L18
MRRLRLAVFRSNKQIYAQVIDDQKGRTVAAASSLKMRGKVTKTGKAAKVGEKIARLALEKKIRKVAFDRRNWKYHGRVRILAEEARKAGLEF